MKSNCFMVGLVMGVFSAFAGKHVYDTYIKPRCLPTFTHEDKVLLEKLRDRLNAVRESHNRVLAVLDYHGYISFLNSAEDDLKNAI